MPYRDRDKQLTYFRERDKRRVEYRKAMRPWWDRVKHANDRAKRYGVSGRVTIAEMQALLAPGTCHWCGKEGPVFPDHVVSMARGGVNRPENMVPACRPCNARKYTKDHPAAWSSYAAACVSCGKTDSRHYARGICNRCTMALRPRRGRAAVA
jgi:5-methylcytosine-specific restriction endonuclease McrA